MLWAPCRKHSPNWAITFPFIFQIKQTKLRDAKVLLPSVTIPFDDQYRFCSVLDGGKRSGVQFYFIDYPPFFDREALYGTSAGDYPDNAERFALYCRAVLEASKVLGVPDIFHCHDWQSALAPSCCAPVMKPIRSFAARALFLPYTTSATRACFPRTRCRF